MRFFLLIIFLFPFYSFSYQGFGKMDSPKHHGQDLEYNEEILEKYEEYFYKNDEKEREYAEIDSDHSEELEEDLRRRWLCLSTDFRGRRWFVGRGQSRVRAYRKSIRKCRKKFRSCKIRWCNIVY